ncbi:MAG: glycosyltransferase family 4 protein [Methylobacter sp.]|nr:glycosyltransferase family 4 protein [Methylobacter sp.]
MKDNNMTKEKRSGQLKRICYVVVTFPQVSETFIVVEAQSLKNFGVDMSLIALNQGNSNLVHPSAKALLEQNQVSYVTNSSRLRSLSALLSLMLKMPLTSLRTLFKALRMTGQRWRYFQALPYAVELINSKADYIHAHFADDNLRLAAILSEWTDIPFGFTAHRYDIFDDPLPVTEFVVLANQASAIVTVSEYNKQFMVEKYCLKPEQIYVAYNGIQTAMFQPNHKPAGHSALCLVSVGRLVPIKGHDILLEALYRIREQGFEVQLRLIGDGASRSDLEAQAQRLNLLDCVEFMGAQAQDMVCQFLNEADVFVMPSRSEGFAVACLEAMAMELPVIASNVTGFPEAITDYVTGILVQSENPELLADAIIWMIQHPEQRLEMGKKGRETVLAKFTREKVTHGLVNYWQKAIFKN